MQKSEACYLNIAKMDDFDNFSFWIISFSIKPSWKKIKAYTQYCVFDVSKKNLQNKFKTATKHSLLPKVISIHYQRNR